jgi:hypothetical protein
MVRIVDAPNANLPYFPPELDNFSAAAITGTVNRTELIAAESHGVPPRGLTVVLYPETTSVRDEVLGRRKVKSSFSLESSPAKLC